MQDKGSPSRLCKANLFRRFLKLCKLQQELNPGKVNNFLPTDFAQYNLEKEKSVDFQVAKKALVKAFEKADLGSWVKKPIEQDEFQAEVIPAESPMETMAAAAADNPNQQQQLDQQRICS